MKVAILSANLGNFDTIKESVEQDLPDGIDEVAFHTFTDSDFPPIGGLTPRLQYRIPKLFGWEMFSGFDYYIWLDGAVSLQRSDCLSWYLEKLGLNDIALFRHPQRTTIRQEVEYIDKKLEEKNAYIVNRYNNGLHKEFLNHIEAGNYPDENLYASTAFVYRNTLKVQAFMREWWFWQSRYFTCDQVQLPYVLWLNDMEVTTIQDNLFKIGYLSLVSHHR